MKDYYKILEIDESASDVEVKAAFRKLSKKFHPDANLGDVSLEHEFKEVQEAYEVLSNAKARTSYTEKLKNYQFQSKFFNTIPLNNSSNSDSYRGNEGYNKENNSFISIFNKNKLSIFFTAFLIVALISYVLFTKPSSDVQQFSAIDTNPRVLLTQTKADLEISLNEKKRIWKKFDGKWSGSASQISIKLNFSVLIDCDFDRNNFTIKYPSLGFGGRLKLLSMEENVVSFEEDLDFGAPNKMKTGRIDLTIQDNNTLDFKYYFQNQVDPVAAGFLKKQ